MADAADLKSVVRKDVRVRLPPSAPTFENLLQPCRLCEFANGAITSFASSASTRTSLLDFLGINSLTFEPSCKASAESEASELLQSPLAIRPACLD